MNVDAELVPGPSQEGVGVGIAVAAPAAPESLPDGWEAATQFHKLKRTLPRHLRAEVEDRAVAAILERARALVRHAARPTVGRVEGWPAEGELDLDATLEQPRPWAAGDLQVARTAPREADVVLILDMSLSMTGEKIALVALAAAILRLKVERLAVVSFDTHAHALVRLAEAAPVREVVRRILRVPAQGYTNIEAGLLCGLERLREGSQRERVGVLMTDGVANVGAEPSAAARRFPRLHVVQVGPEEPQGTRACARMAEAGRGRVYRAVLYQQLPGVMRVLVRQCFGG